MAGMIVKMYCKKLMIIYLASNRVMSWTYVEAARRNNGIDKILVAQNGQPIL